MLILRTLTLGSLHGYAIAQHIAKLSDGVLQVEQGSLYPALERLLNKGWVTVKWAADADQTAGAVLHDHEIGTAAARGQGVRLRSRRDAIARVMGRA